jgi:hypothetical protein
LFSCSARKVEISKIDTKTYTDSKSVTTKDSVSVQQNAIFVKETNYEIEVVPVDTSKPITIGDIKYYNAVVRFKKKEVNKVDTSKTTVSQKTNIKSRIKSNSSTKVVDKKVDKKSSYLFFLWLLLIPLVAYIIVKHPLK